MIEYHNHDDNDDDGVSSASSLSSQSSSSSSLQRQLVTQFFDPFQVSLVEQEYTVRSVSRFLFCVAVNSDEGLSFVT